MSDQDQDQDQDTPSADTRAPRQWIIDRSNGTSKDDEALRPPLPCCNVPPCVKWCPTVLEQNKCCETLGACGFFDSKNQTTRTRLMALGLASNIVGMILTIVACFAITSSNYDILTSTSFSSGDVALTDVNDAGESGFQPVDIAVGLTAIAINNPNFDEIKRVINFDELCDEGIIADLRVYFPAEECDSCNEISKSMVSTLLVSVVTYLPSIFTNFTRMYHNYDVNCQKNFGVFVTAFSLILSLSTIMNYRNNCIDKFYDGTVTFDENRVPVEDPDSDEAFATIDFDWTGGAGLKCLLAATVIKIVDVLVHLSLPSPSITRNREEQANYEKTTPDPDHNSEEQESHDKNSMTNEKDDIETRIPKEEESDEIPNALPEVK